MDNELLDRYIAGECALSEVRRVNAWLAAHPVMGDVVAQLRTGSAFGLVDTDVDWRRVRAAMERRESVGRSFGKRLPVWRGVSSGSTMWRGAWSAVAAVLAIVVVVASWNLGERHNGRRAATSMMTYTTGNGERATISLPDGGTVALNVASRLEVPMDYMTRHRTVRLVGEGLFTVSHHAGTPLTVVAGGTEARVLGTSFVVRRYATDTSAIVAVRDGKVAVGATVVTANQLVEVGRSGVPRVRLLDGSQFTFATGTLTIDGLLLPAAIVELNRWYDADIRLGDPALAGERMKGKFGAGSLSDLAENLGALYDVRVVRDGRVLTLYPKR